MIYLYVKLKLKEKHGFFWRSKESFNLFKEDVKSIPSLLSSGKNKISSAISGKNTTKENLIEDKKEKPIENKKEELIEKTEEKNNDNNTEKSIIDVVYDATSHTESQKAPLKHKNNSKKTKAKAKANTTHKSRKDSKIIRSL